jgi:adenine/guanine phosphoribosyltransferase-like PRPP-binding protein
MIHSGTGFMHLDDLQEKVDRTVQGLQRTNKRFDSIAVRGASGIVVGAPVSLALGKPLLIVRKPDEQCHNRDHRVVNWRNAGECAIFLDDFITRGDTFGHVVSAIQQHTQATIKWGYMYDDYSKHWFSARDY